MVQYLVETAGLTVRVIKSTEEVEQVRRQQQEAQARQQALEQQMVQAEQANKVAPFIKAQATAAQE